MAGHGRDDYEQFSHLAVEVTDGVATVRFKASDSEDFEHSFFTDIRDVFVPLSRDPDVRSVVLAVQPPPATTSRFGELITTATLEQRAGRFLTIQQVYTSLATFRQPIVAAVTAHASGIMAVLALLCDAVVATEAAEFSDTHVEIGISAGDGGPAIWPLLVGPGLAKQVLLEGRKLGAHEAQALGLVSKVVPADEIFAAAAELAGRLGRLSRVGFLSTKLAINNHLRFAALIATDLTAAYEAATVAEPDFIPHHSR